MENEQNNGRPVEFTDEERLARVVGATGIHDLAEAGFVVMTIKDAEAAEADTALLRQALLEVIRGYGVHGHYHAFDTARTALSSTNAGQSLLDRLKSAEEQVQQLTSECGAMKRRLIGRPDWRCMKCGHYASGSGKWACGSCGEWHTWEPVGDHNWHPDSEQGKAWLEPVTAHFESWLQKAAATPDKLKEGSNHG